MALRIERIPTLSDNYTYLVICDETNRAAIVDAPEVDPVVERVAITGAQRRADPLDPPPSRPLDGEPRARRPLRRSGRRPRLRREPDARHDEGRRRGRRAARRQPRGPRALHPVPHDGPRRLRLRPRARRLHRRHALRRGLWAPLRGQRADDVRRAVREARAPCPTTTSSTAATSTPRTTCASRSRSSPRTRRSRSATRPCASCGPGRRRIGTRRRPPR